MYPYLFKLANVDLVVLRVLRVLKGYSDVLCT